ncbi:MAG TPA: hypothetical protein VMU99_10205 [Acidimicrobiales bacterium]|nr:hypothetical protein [Acidimicrobiales bacterium]
MNVAHVTGALLAVDKHKLAGTVGIIIGIGIVGVGAFRAIRRTTGAMVMALAGIVVIGLALLLYFRKV